VDTRAEPTRRAFSIIAEVGALREEAIRNPMASKVHHTGRYSNSESCGVWSASIFASLATFSWATNNMSLVAKSRGSHLNPYTNGR